MDFFMATGFKNGFRKSKFTDLCANPSAMIRRFSTILILSFCSFLTSHAQGFRQLGDSAKVSLLTCGTGQDMYTYFGHSAIRITDPANRINRVYNYGTFDFNVPNFYWQFIRGKMYYMLSVTRSESFMNEYINENRYIHELPLLLTREEKQELFNLLEINNLPENKHYWYDFFKDNCSTRVRDMVHKATGGKYPWPVGETDLLTFRQLIDPYLKPHPWPRAGIMMMLAAGADQKATFEEYMFLPEQMEQIFKMARSSEGEALAGAERVLFEPLPESQSRPIRPWMVAGLMAALSLFLLVSGKTKTLTNLWFAFIFLISGILGVLFTFMWVGSEHWVCHGNLNLGWAIPLNLIFVGTIWFPRLFKFNHFLSTLFLIPLILFLLTFPFWKQAVPVEAILLAISVGAGLLRLSGLLGLAKPKPKDQAN
jgi:hypothetical protein